MPDNRLHFIPEVSTLQTLQLSSGTATQKKPAPPIKRRNGIDFRAWLSRIPFGAQEAKITVILVFTLCWLAVILVRSHTPRDPAALEGSSLMALAKSMQQGLMSGRDFQSTYGLAAQFLAWCATAVTFTGSALGAYGMITFFFCAASAILAATLLLMVDRISWQQSAIFYVFAIFLNLFFDVLDFRALLLLLNAVFAYRAIAAETLDGQTLWATATGLLCFVSQLVTIELGLCAAVVVVGALIAGSVLNRSTLVLLAIEVFVATLAAANLGLVILFKLTSSRYGLLFDYHNYALEILMGRHSSMGVLWRLSSTETMVLTLVAVYVIGVSIASIWRSDPVDASLVVSLAFAAVVWLKTALIQSDVPHITFAFTPTIFVLSLHAREEWVSLKRGVAWGIAVLALLLVWPSLNLSAPADVMRVLRGQASAKGAVLDLYSAGTTLEPRLRTSVTTRDLADRSHISVLAFPYDNYIAVGLPRPLFAPVLESYAASLDSLERYYVDALDRQRRAGLEIVYGLDKADVPSVDGLQAITRTPLVFEYIYKHFELVGSDEHADGHYILRARPKPRDEAVDQLQFSVRHQVVDSGRLKLNAPTACGLVRVKMRINYPRSAEILRPRAIVVSLNDGDQRVWQGSIRTPEPDQSFVTYFSPLPPPTFHQVFGEGPVRARKWDELEYLAPEAGRLGAKASRIDVESLHCVDPVKFVDATPASFPK